VSELNVEIDGLDDAIRKLRRAGGNELARQITAGLVAIGKQVENELRQYPPKPKYPLRWASRRQAFYVKHILRKNLGPYVRRYDPMSQNLQQSWTVEPLRPIGAVVGTRVTYAPYVQSEEKQQPFHADTGWITDREAVENVQASGDIERILQAARNKLLR